MSSTRRKPKPPADPWLRQPDESDQAYEAFEVYRDMGPARSVRKVVDHMGKAHSLIGRWSGDNQWVIRSAAFDRYQERLSAEDTRKEHERARKKHATLGVSLQTKALQALQALDAATLKPSDIAKFMELGYRMERDALGLATATLDVRTGQAADGTTVGAMTAEETFIRLRQLGGALAQRLADQDKAVPAGLLAYKPDEDDEIDDAEVVDEDEELMTP